MRTQIAKTEYLPAEYIRVHFDSCTPSPFPQVDGGGCYREKFFLILFFFVSPIRFLLVFYFFIFSNFARYLWSLCWEYFSDFVIVLVWFWLPDYRLIVSIFNLLVLTRLIFARYSLFVLRYIFLASISTCFGIVNSTLRLFISLTLLLVKNKHLCLCKFGLCLFWLF